MYVYVYTVEADRIENRITRLAVGNAYSNCNLHNFNVALRNDLEKIRHKKTWELYRSCNYVPINVQGVLKLKYNN